MDEEEQLKLAAQSGDSRAAYLYNQLLVDHGRVDLDGLPLEGLSKFDNYESIPILIHILEVAPTNNYKLLAAIYLIGLKASEATSIFLRDLDTLRSTVLNENLYRNKLIDGLVAFRAIAAIPILVRIVKDAEEFDDIRGPAASALVKLAPDVAQETLPEVWKQANISLRRSLLHTFEEGCNPNNDNFYLEYLAEAISSADPTTRQIAASNLIGAVLKTTLFGFEDFGGRPPLEQMYKNNTRYLEVEHRVVKAIKATHKVRTVLDVICQDWQSLYNLLFAARIVRHFPKKIVSIYRGKIKGFLLNKENRDIGLRYRDSYPIIRAIRIALNLRER